MEEKKSELTGAVHRRSGNVNPSTHSRILHQLTGHFPQSEFTLVCPTGWTTIAFCPNQLQQMLWGACPFAPGPPWRSRHLSPRVVSPADGFLCLPPWECSQPKRVLSPEVTLNPRGQQFVDRASASPAQEDNSELHRMHFLEGLEQDSRWSQLTTLPFPGCRPFLSLFPSSFPAHPGITPKQTMCTQTFVSESALWGIPNGGPKLRHQPSSWLPAWLPQAQVLCWPPEWPFRSIICLFPAQKLPAAPSWPAGTLVGCPPPSAPSYFAQPLQILPRASWDMWSSP